MVKELDGVQLVGHDRLIPLKAVAWLELTARKEQGGKIANGLRRFCDAAAADRTLDPRAIGLGKTPLTDVLARVAQAYGLVSRP